MNERTRRPTHRGFTLIELIVIIMIITIMSSIVVPAYARFWAKARFDATVRNVTDVFRQARELAIAHDVTTTVTFNPGSATLTLTTPPSASVSDQPSALAEADDSNANDPVPPPREETLGEEFRLDDFVAGGGNNNNGNGDAHGGARSGAGGLTELRFRSDGTTDGARLTLSSASGYRAQMTVWPATGRVTLDDSDNANQSPAPGQSR